MPTPIGDHGGRIIGRAEKHEHALEEGVAAIDPVEFDEELFEVRPIVARFTGIAGRVESRRAAQRADDEPRIVGDVWETRLGTRVARSQDGVFDEGEAGLRDRSWLLYKFTFHLDEGESSLPSPT